ncbi:MAG TPA: type I DNA topoisomerase [Alphaproteobacteria bacterium]|nr:type I DNA topoisomerase [Alphaproteobacteria bacterium]
MTDVVVVESPAKAKTINKYLGKGYVVVASYGHVRDLPPKDGSVRPDEDFAMSWEVDGGSEKHIRAIASAVKGGARLFLATDPDREGEAISWHVLQLLRERNAIKDVDVKRVVFNEITKDAVLDAMSHPRDVNRELVEAYLARRALDYLVGFTLSPVLWRKLPGSRSAGRVQSVALRLVCEREAEIEKFKPQEYWTIDVEFRTVQGQGLTARLTHLNGRKLDKFDLGDKAKADAAVAAILRGDYSIAKVERKQQRRHPYPPFTTSTLQQEASRKLGFGASRTMRIAQRLYEGVDLGGETQGLITYMRTDSVSLANEAVGATRRLIEQQYGKNYLPDQPRRYKTKAKNAQEAHEAIRPTDLFRRPQDVAKHLDEDQRRLYELIWLRTVASQMESAVLDQVIIDIADKSGAAVLRATGSIVLFDGYLRLYQEGRDDPAEDDEEGRRLPQVKEGEAVARGDIKPEQHFTQPPPRYTEASLVKRLEELGIGRPSTYASILQVLQDRKYVRLEKARFVPEDRGRIVTAFLESFFQRYVEYNFTADLENKLDEISDGRIDWKQVLREFWIDFSKAVAGTKDLSITQVIDTLNEELSPHFFPPQEDGSDPRLCPVCRAGKLGLKLGKFGAFIGCSNYPECRYTRALEVASNGNGGGPALEGPKELGVDPGSKKPVYLRKGPYGYYVQLGGELNGNGNGNGAADSAQAEASPTAEAENGEGAPGKRRSRKKAKSPPAEKPKRVSLPRGTKPEDMTLELAVQLLSLPREIGTHPQTGKPISAGLGRFGPYIKHENTFKSVGSIEDVLTIGLNRAVDLLSQAKSRGPAALRDLGPHPGDGTPVRIMKGRYGAYIKHGSVNATLPKDASPETLTMEQAVQLLAARAAAGVGNKGPRARTSRAAVKGAKSAKSGAAKEKAAKAAPRRKNAATITDAE